MLRKTSKRLVAAMLSGVLAFSNAPLALAKTSGELQSELNVAMAELDNLGAQIQAAGEQLYETQYSLYVTGLQIEETKGQIAERQEELAGAQDVLGKRVSAGYKAGGTGLLSIILSSASFEEFLSNFYYARKVVAADAEAIQNVKDIKAALTEQQTALEQQEAEQKRLLEAQVEQKAELERQEAAQAAYVNQLSDELVAAIEAERQAELERQRQAAIAQAEALAAQMIAQAEAEAAAGGSYDGGSSYDDSASYSGGSSSSGSSSSYSGGSSSSSYSGGSSYSGSTSSSGGLSAAQRNAILQAAYSQVGVPYQLGTSNPGTSFDCSGFAMYAYEAAGVELPHSSAAQSQTVKSISQDDLQPGDLVFWIGTGGQATGGNHVAIYAGDGKIIHSSYGGVVEQDLYGGVTGYGSVG